MSDVYMHSRMTEDLIAKRQADVDTPVAFLGAQCSDPMYYATFHPQRRRYRRIADRMHDTDTQKLLINLVEHVKEHPTKINRSFLFGFLAHYALDVKIHPYVYHHVGVYDKTNPTTHPWRGLHLKFERSIDAVLFEREQNKPSRRLRLVDHYFPLKEAPHDIIVMMKDVLQKQFQIDDGDTVYATSVRHMYRILRYLTTDRFGIKKQVYKIVDFLYRKPDLFLSDMSFFGHIEAYDFLNLDKRTWHHPVTNEPFDTSVPELYQEAIVFAEYLLDHVEAYLAGETIDLFQVFTNLSFNSGVECTVSHPFQHFQIYRPKNNL